MTDCTAGDGVCREVPAERVTSVQQRLHVRAGVVGTPGPAQAPAQPQCGQGQHSPCQDWSRPSPGSSSRDMECSQQDLSDRCTRGKLSVRASGDSDIRQHSAAG